MYKFNDNNMELLNGEKPIEMIQYYDLIAKNIRKLLENVVHPHQLSIHEFLLKKIYYII